SLLPLGAVRPSFEERVTVRVKEVAVSWRKPQLAVPTTVMHQPEQRQELGPGAVAQVHCVGESAGVGAEPLEKARDGVVLDVNFVLRHQPTVLSIQQEYKPQQHREQARIYLVRFESEHFPEQAALAEIIGALKPAEQFVQCGQHLLRQL